MTADGRGRAIVLGSAAGGGFPQWNCRCAVCELAWSGDARVRARTQSSLALTGDGRDWLLVNASPDLGAQLRATPDLHPVPGSLRGSPIRDVLLTSADVDHCAGLLALRERHHFRLLATDAVHAALDRNPILGVLDRAVVERVTVRPGERLRVAGLDAELVPVPGKAPLYLEADDPALGSEDGEAVALAVTGGPAGPLIYVPGCASPSAALAVRLRDAGTILFDGTLYTDDEMIRTGTGTKTGRRMGHMPISGEGGSLDWLGRFPGRRVYVHVNNTNPILVEGSPERRAVEAAGFGVAEDGMEFGL